MGLEWTAPQSSRDTVWKINAKAFKPATIGSALEKASATSITNPATALNTVNNAPTQDPTLNSIYENVLQICQEDGLPLTNEQIQRFQAFFQNPGQMYNQLTKQEKLVLGCAVYDVTGRTDFFNDVLPVRNRMAKDALNPAEAGVTPEQAQRRVATYDAQVEYIIDHTNWLTTHEPLGTENLMGERQYTQEHLRRSKKYLLTASSMVEMYGLKHPELIEKVLNRSPFQENAQLAQQNGLNLQNRFTMIINNDPKPPGNVAASYVIADNSISINMAHMIPGLLKMDGFTPGAHEVTHAVEAVSKTDAGFQLPAGVHPSETTADNLPLYFNGQLEGMTQAQLHFVTNAIETLNKLPTDHTGEHWNYPKEAFFIRESLEMNPGLLASTPLAHAGNNVTLDQLKQLLQSHTLSAEKRQAIESVVAEAEFLANAEGIAVTAEYFIEGRGNDIETLTGETNFNEAMAEYFGFDPTNGYRIVA